jgi:23S rRNA pseudouridine2605 synthase/23S rRNA pseudouridine2604 synthase
MRLNKFIASTGLCSRRKADELIFKGKVKVNENTMLFPSYDVKSDDIVLVEGKILKREKYVYYLFYKPLNVLTSYDDKRGRKSLRDFEFFKTHNLGYSGRLDYKSEGLILFTNNGDLIYRLQTPKYKVEKEYEVEVDKILTLYQNKVLEKGLKTDDFVYLNCKIDKINEKKYKIVLIEGKNRQIRNMFAHFNIKVLRLVRTRIGKFTIENMKPGDIKELSEDDIKENLYV